ncbi:unnamed protein product, partial [Fusarium langsethiae]
MSNFAERMLQVDMALSADGTPRQREYAEAGKRRGNRRNTDSQAGESIYIYLPAPH